MLKQIIFHIEEAKDQVQLNFKEVKRKNKHLPSENLFHFTEYLEKQKVESEVDLGLVLKIAEKNKILYNQIAVNALVGDTKKMKNGFFTNVN